MIRCLVVEDNQKDLNKILRYIGANENPQMVVVAHCDNIEMASELLQKHKPDLIFLDIDLASEINGLEYLQLLKKVNIRLPPVVITTSTPPTSTDISSLQTIGRIVVLRKPYDTKEFKEILAALHPIVPKTNIKTNSANSFIEVADSDDQKSPIRRMIDMKHVVFARSQGQGKWLRLKDNTKVFYWGNFDLLRNNGFTEIHRSNYVNFSTEFAEFAYNAADNQLIVTIIGKQHRLDVRPKFTAQELLNYLNNR
jgi:DNA-binding LytR/AlgR family response regulator